MAKLEFKNIEYMSQYVSYDYDEFVELFNDIVVKYPLSEQDEVVEIINKLNDLMGDVNDNINEKFFGVIFNEDNTIYTLREIKSFYECLTDEDFDKLDEILDNSISDMMYDLEIYEVSALTETVDESLRRDGLNSSFVYLAPAIKELHSNAEYVVMNGYGDGFAGEYESRNAALHDVFSQRDDELVDKFIDSII